MDYGYNVKYVTPPPDLHSQAKLISYSPPHRLGENVYVNSNSTWIDTCLITVGDRTLIGPNCSCKSLLFCHTWPSRRPAKPPKLTSQKSTAAHIRWNPVSATAPAGQNRVSQSPSVRTAGSAATSSCCPGSPSARA
ncbi:hypothetical protein BDP81DRAFT_164002 [Colletotrichum phormii]|uniref:Mannose-1-phosphate guanylyltransferase n=1 Tax=Colletotrichum phormii TaxID=359342 RepID=A0AAJ0A1N2_9PEZI|nr:uncharacterized protein BDP81DRAFT_164002 [Colletotrichum phormii]KAK1640472.1 hypothetical protein BDP81DRAFT_164002 [Colletotrichum phormii]